MKQKPDVMYKGIPIHEEILEAVMDKCLSMTTAEAVKRAGAELGMDVVSVIRFMEDDEDVSNEFGHKTKVIDVISRHQCDILREGMLKAILSMYGEI